MKQWVALIVTTIMVLTVSACGGGSKPSSNTNASTKTDAGSAKAVEAPKSKYPEKPIGFTLPVGPGNGLDALGRSLVKILDKTKLVTQPITIENKPGGGQVVGTIEYANKEKKNDYQLLVTSTPLILNNLKKEGNNPISFRDLTPLARLEADYAVIAVKTDSKYKDLKSLMADLRTNSSNIVVAGGTSPGSFDHLNIIITAGKAGIDAKTVKYIYFGGGAEALTALLGGNAQAMTSTLSETWEFVKSGKVRLLAVSAPSKLSGKFADLPTYKDQGLDVELVNWRAILGPKEMSGDTKKFWDDKLKAMVATEEWKNDLEAKGLMDGYLNSADFLKSLEKEEAMYKEIYTQLGLAK